MNSSAGNLYLIPTTLGDIAPLKVLPDTVKQYVENIDTFIVENEKAARRFIKQICPEKSQPSLKLFLLNKHTNHEELPTFIASCLQGIDVGLLSDAGCPAVADPGSDIVKIAHQKNIKVIPLVGPSSILMALMSSGMNGQGFTFNGYLPIEKNDRKNKIKQLERTSFEQNQSQIFIETPYRNNKMLDDLVKYLESQTALCVACDITLETEFIKTQSARDWKNDTVDLHKRPSIFIIHKA